LLLIHVENALPELFHGRYQIKQQKEKRKLLVSGE